MKPLSQALLGAALCLVSGAAWLLGGDALVAAWGPDPAVPAAYQALKGWLVLVPMSLLAAGLLWRAARTAAALREHERATREWFERREVVFVHDITALKLAEAQRREGEALLQRVLRAVPDPLWVKGLDGRYLLWNPAFETMVARPGDAIGGHTDAEVFGPEAGAGFHARDLEVLRMGKVRYQGPSAPRPDGHVAQVESTKVPLLDAHGSAAGVLGIAHDVTAVHEALQRRQDAEATTNRLLAQSQASRRALLSVVEDHQLAEAALRQSQARLSAVVSALPDLLLLWDRQGRCIDLWAGPHVRTTLPRDAMLGHTIEEFAPAYVAGRMREAFDRAMAGDPAPLFEFEMTRPSGTRHWFEVRTARVGADQVLSMARNITERYQLDERQRLFTAVFEHTQEGVLITDADWNILSTNRAFTRLLGYTEEEIRGQSLWVLALPDQPVELVLEVREALQATGRWRGESSNRHKSGEAVPFLVSMTTVTDGAGQPTQRVVMYTDISRIKRSEAELSFLAHHDPLTRLPNRLMFQRRVEQAVLEAQRGGRRCATLMLDLDHFKDINDSYGHTAGDELLQQVAHRLSQRLRKVDTLARVGGDEFALLLQEVGHPEDAARVASELIATLAQPLRLANGAEVTVGASVGISLYPEHGQEPSALMQGADAALYHAKGGGRGVFRFYSDEMTRQTRERLELEQRLRRAVADGHLLLHYQPQVDIRSGAIIGVEALVRWLDPVEGLVPPMRFIPVAEATGMIAEIGLWVLREACRQGRAWIDAGLPPLTMAVNVSPRQFHRGDLAAQVTQVLLDTGFPPGQLELEVTESALMEREAEALEMLQRLRGLGVGVAIDDFGTGYSSLAYLRRFPLDVLKIDRSFIADVPHHADDMAIASAIIAMGHSLGIKVLAEGVETMEQLDFLRLKGCDRFQGYLRSKPLPADAFLALWQVNDRATAETTFGI